MRRGIDLKDHTNAKLFKLREALRAFREQDGQKVDPSEIEKHWAVIGRCERALQAIRGKHREMAEELSGHLVAACESIVRHAAWPATSVRWKTMRRILRKLQPILRPSRQRNRMWKEITGPAGDGQRLA